MERCRRASGGEADLTLEQYRWQTERKRSMKTRGAGQAGAWEGKDGWGPVLSLAVTMWEFLPVTSTNEVRGDLST